MLPIPRENISTPNIDVVTAGSSSAARSLWSEQCARQGGWRKPTRDRSYEACPETGPAACKASVDDAVRENAGERVGKYTPQDEGRAGCNHKCCECQNPGAHSVRERTHSEPTDHGRAIQKRERE